MSDFKWVIDDLPPNEPIPGVENPFDVARLADGGIIDEDNPYFLISCIPLDQQTARIGGVVVLCTEELMNELSSMLPVVPG